MNYSTLSYAVFMRNNLGCEEDVYNFSFHWLLAYLFFKKSEQYDIKTQHCMPSINWLKANLVIDLLVGDISHPILFIKLKSSVSH